MNGIKENLIAARKLIEKKENWWDGNPDTKTPKNCCAIQALTRIAKREIVIVGDVESALANTMAPSTEVIKMGPYQIITDFNDHHTYEEVLAKFDEAIANEQ